MCHCHSTEFWSAVIGKWNEAWTMRYTFYHFKKTGWGTDNRVCVGKVILGFIDLGNPCHGNVIMAIVITILPDLHYYILVKFNLLWNRKALWHLLPYRILGEFWDSHVLLLSTVNSMNGWWYIQTQSIEINIFIQFYLMQDRNWMKSL